MELESGNGTVLRQLEGFLELVESAPDAYQNSNPDEKRELVKQLVSNLVVADKKVDLTPFPAVDLLVNRLKTSNGAPSRGVHRTRIWSRILKKLLQHFAEAPAEPKSLIGDLPLAA